MLFESTSLIMEFIQKIHGLFANYLINQIGGFCFGSQNTFFNAPDGCKVTTPVMYKVPTTQHDDDDDDDDDEALIMRPCLPQQLVK